MDCFEHIQRCKGNALFLVLIAIVLFAALVFTLTSSRTSGSSISKEQAKLMASNIISFATNIEVSVSRAMVSGADMAQLNFADGSTGRTNSVASTNSNCPVGAPCNIFLTSRGGWIPSIKFDERYVSSAYRAYSPTFGGGDGSSFMFMMMNVRDVGTSATDLVLWIRGLPTPVCNALNGILLEDDTTQYQQYYSVSGSYNFSGTLSQVPTGTGGSTVGALSGQRAYCGSRTISGGYDGGDYIHVIVPR